MARKIIKKANRKASRKMYKRMKAPTNAVRQFGYMSDRMNMMSQKAKGTYARYMKKEEPVSMEKPKRRTMKRVMKKKSKKMSGIFDKKDILPTAAGAGAGALIGGGSGAVAGGLIGYGASKVFNRKK